MTKREQFDNVIEHIEEGNSLRDALRQSESPSSKTFYEWIDLDEDKRKRYARACSKRADEIFEDIIKIADETEDDTIEITEDGVVKTKVDHENIQRAKLRVDARKWMLGKMNPKKYGDKVEQTIKTDNSPFTPIDLNVPRDNSTNED